MTITKNGSEAQEQAREWEAPEPERVVETRKASHIGCRWVSYEDGFERCMACGDGDFQIKYEDEDDPKPPRRATRVPKKG